MLKMSLWLILFRAEGKTQGVWLSHHLRISSTLILVRPIQDPNTLHILPGALTNTFLWTISCIISASGCSHFSELVRLRRSAANLFNSVLLLWMIFLPTLLNLFEKLKVYTFVETQKCHLGHFFPILIAVTNNLSRLRFSVTLVPWLAFYFLISFHLIKTRNITPYQ